MPALRSAPLLLAACRYLQPDKCLYHLNLAVDQDFLQYVDKVTEALDGDFHQYEQRAMCRVATASSESEVRQFLPLPHTGTLAFTLQDIQKYPPSVHNMGWTLDDHFARENVFLVDFYVGAVNSFGMITRTIFCRNGRYSKLQV